MNAVIYARFSSDRQSDASIYAQVRACREYAERNGYNITNVYADEAISGREAKTELRREYQRMLKDARKGLFSAILIHKYDRVARSLSEHVNLEAKLKQYDIDLIAVAQDFGNTNEAKIMRALMWSMSEYYSDNLASEVKKGHKETALKALHNGGYAPFGYDVVEQHYVINELEAEYVRRIYACALRREGFKDIMQEMKEEGIKGKRGSVIKYPAIYEILRNEKYTGVYTYSPQEETNRADRRSKPNAIRIENAFPAIISKEDFERVQKIMDSRKQSGRKADYLCSGMVYCSCGAKMHAYVSHRNGNEYRYYRCSEVCGARMVHMEEVDRAARNYLTEILTDDVQVQLHKVLHEYENFDHDRIQGFSDAIEKKIAAKQNEYDNIVKNISCSVLPAAVMQDFANKLNEIKAEIDSLKAATPPEDYTVDDVKAWLNSIKAAPSDDAVKLLVDRIDVIPTDSKTDYKVSSTLQSVLEIVVAGKGFEPMTSGL